MRWMPPVRIRRYNSLVSPPDGISVESSPIPQRILSQRLDDHSFGLVIAAATDADKARLLSTSAPHAASWLSVVPSVGLGLHLDSNELQIAVKWWLGLDTSRGSSCALCPDETLDPLGHHAATCRRGGDVVIRHNRLRDVFLSFCHQAHIAARLEAGSGLTPGLDCTRQADVLVRDWAQGKPAAFDITVTSPLTPAILAEASRRVGAAAEAAENTANDPKCAELGWRCVPLAVETYCNWVLAVANGVSVLVCLLAAILLCCLKLYKKIVYRLALYQNLKKLEVLYVVTSLLIPALIAIVPLVTHAYGLSPGGNGCYIYANTSVAFIERLALWDGPTMLMLIAASTAMVVMVTKTDQSSASKI
eukprot:Em0259g4a